MRPESALDWVTEPSKALGHTLSMTANFSPTPIEIDVKIRGLVPLTANVNVFESGMSRPRPV